MKKSASYEEKGINMHAVESRKPTFFITIARGDEHLLRFCSLVLQRASAQQVVQPTEQPIVLSRASAREAGLHPFVNFFDIF